MTLKPCHCPLCQKPDPAVLAKIDRIAEALEAQARRATNPRTVDRDWVEYITREGLTK